MSEHFGIQLIPNCNDITLPPSYKYSGFILDADATIFRHDDLEAYPDGWAFLNKLGSFGIRYAFVSNNPNEELARLRSEKLDLPPELYIFPNRIRDFKPSPVMVKQALGALCIGPEDSIGVADGITDAIAYRLAGVKDVKLVIRDPLEAKGYPGRPKVRQAWYQKAGIVGA